MFRNKEILCGMERKKMELPKLPADLNAPYQKMYIKLFKAVTGALELMNDGEFLLAREFLVSAQQETEELYIEADRKKSAAD